MNTFKLRRFHALIILQCVRWHCKYVCRSYREREEMMGERGVAVRPHDGVLVDAEQEVPLQKFRRVA